LPTHHTIASGQTQSKHAVVRRVPRVCRGRTTAVMKLTHGLTRHEALHVRCVVMPFETTRWSLVLAAAGDNSLAARDALSSLCQTYWYPLYAYLRRRGLDPEDARDLTQGFLTTLIERQDFEGLRQDRGRFRAFLLASLKHYLSNWSARERTQKRGGGRDIVPLESAEGLYVAEPVDHTTPETLFERRWALTVVDGLLAELRAQWTAQGRAPEFDELKSCLLGQGPAGGYATVAARLGTSEGAVKAAVHERPRRSPRAIRRSLPTTSPAPPSSWPLKSRSWQPSAHSSPETFRLVSRRFGTFSPAGLHPSRCYSQ
jgi:RNA polymerase sigma-70 factor (ECF subfamily)